MQESIQAAFTVVRSRADSLGIKPNFYEKYDVHIHVPEGATPKDGPSAGGAMAISLISIFTEIPVRSDTAMIPKENEADLQEIPEQILKSLNIIPVEWIDEVISHALIKEPTPVNKSSTTTKTKSARSRKSKTENKQAH